MCRIKLSGKHTSFVDLFILSDSSENGRGVHFLSESFVRTGVGGGWGWGVAATMFIQPSQICRSHMSLMKPGKLNGLSDINFLIFYINYENVLLTLNKVIM